RPVDEPLDERKAAHLFLALGADGPISLVARRLPSCLPIEFTPLRRLRRSAHPIPGARRRGPASRDGRAAVPPAALPPRSPARHPRAVPCGWTPREPPCPPGRGSGGRLRRRGHGSWGGRAPRGGAPASRDRRAH